MSTQDRINELERQVKELKEQYAKEQKQGECWPKYDDTYYYVSDRLVVFSTRYNTACVDNIFLKSFNCFQTKEQAQRRVDMLYVQNELFHLAEKYNKDKLNAKGRWYYICYNKDKKMLEALGFTNTIYSFSKFENESAANNAIAALSDRSKEWFKNQI